MFSAAPPVPELRRWQQHMQLVFFWTNAGSETFTVAGICVNGNWGISSHPRVTNTGRTAPYSDPLYGEQKTMHIYRFQGDEASVEIGFDEIANGVFLAFAARADLQFCEPRFSWTNGKLIRDKN